MISYSNLSFVSVQAVDHEKEVEGPEVPLCPGLLTHEIAAREVVSEKKKPFEMHSRVNQFKYLLLHGQEF